MVAEMLGPAAERRRQSRARRARADALRVAVAVAVVVALLVLGLVATDSPGDRTLNGRAGEVHGQR